MKKNKIIMIILVLLFVILVVWGALFSIKKNKDVSQVVNKNKVVKLYENTNSDCTEVIDDHSQKTYLYLIFGQMKKDKVLKDDVTLDDYKISANKILKENNIPESFDSFIFEGYDYSLKDNSLIRKKTTCPSKRYVSKMFGYTSKDDMLYVDIASGYILDNKVYDLKNKELGNYEEKSLNGLLDKGTVTTYIYKLDGQNYKLEKVSER